LIFAKRQLAAGAEIAIAVAPPAMDVYGWFFSKNSIRVLFCCRLVLLYSPA
jgi:hypothetical protein